MGVLEPDGTLIEANKAALDSGGLERDDVVGMKFWETPWFQYSEDIQHRVRADIREAAEGTSVKHELNIPGPEKTAIVDFSIHPLFDNQGNVRRLIVEGHDITSFKQRPARETHSQRGRSNSTRLVSYSREANESVSQAILQAYFALGIDVLDKDRTLEDQIHTDALNELAWRSDCPHTVVTRLWGYSVEVTSDEVRIYDTPSDASRSDSRF